MSTIAQIDITQAHVSSRCASWRIWAEMDWYDAAIDEASLSQHRQVSQYSQQ